jgi:hypothetical protein
VRSPRIVAVTVLAALVGAAAGAGAYAVFNSDSGHYGGTNVGNIGEVQAVEGKSPELRLTVPPLAAIFLVPES